LQGTKNRQDTTNRSGGRKALPAWLHEYNHHRLHTAIGKATPISRLTHLPGQYTPAGQWPRGGCLVAADRARRREPRRPRPDPSTRTSRSWPKETSSRPLARVRTTRWRVGCVNGSTPRARSCCRRRSRRSPRR
jgi:hypothetical protein